MSEINNHESLRTWLMGCPEIAKSHYFGADYMGENATEYALIAVPSALRYRENIWGDRKLLTNQEQNFIFAAKVPYGSDIRQNLENSAFFQSVQKWISSQNETHSFPEWDGGNVTAIECSSTGAPIQTGTDAARYQFQIKVAYKVTQPQKVSDIYA